MYKTTMPAADQKVFIVEGNMGAGKSTFLKILERALRVQVVQEPVAEWQAVGGTENLLAHFYNDTNRWAYTFQSYAFVTRVRAQEQMALINPTNIQILERSVYSDRYCFAKNCFEMGKMTELEWKLYQEWFSWLVDNYTVKPAGFIYLQTDPEVCYERMAKRNRSAEAAVPLSYVQLLHDKHEEWLLEKRNIASYLKDIPVLILPCNKDFESDPREQEKHIESIISFMYANNACTSKQEVRVTSL
jgi:deoxyadenosine/deoxycytidine kinase